MSYTVSIGRRARKQLESLPERDRETVRAAIDALAQEPRPANCIKMSGSSSWRLRVGVYRVVYDIFDDQLLVEVIEVGHRRDVYR